MRFILTALLLLAFSAPAAASINSDLRLAKRFWQARNVQLCDPVTWGAVKIEPRLGFAAVVGQAWVESCYIELNRDYVAFWRAADSWEKRNRCALIVHEVGHFGGLEHSSDPRSVMYPSRTRHQEQIPWACVLAYPRESW